MLEKYSDGIVPYSDIHMICRVPVRLYIDMFSWAHFLKCHRKLMEASQWLRENIATPEYVATVVKPSHRSFEIDLNASRYTSSADWWILKLTVYYIPSFLLEKCHSGITHTQTVYVETHIAQKCNPYLNCSWSINLFCFSFTVIGPEQRR